MNVTLDGYDSQSVHTPKPHKQMRTLVALWRTNVSAICANVMHRRARANVHACNVVKFAASVETYVIYISYNAAITYLHACEQILTLAQ